MSKFSDWLKESIEIIKNAKILWTLIALLMGSVGYGVNEAEKYTSEPLQAPLTTLTPKPIPMPPKDWNKAIFDAIDKATKEHSNSQHGGSR